MTSFLKTSLIIFFLFLFGQANGQSAIQQQIDSLEKELVKLNNDSAKLKIIPRLIVSYLPTSNRDRTWELIDLLGSLSKKTNNHVHYTGSLFYAGIVHFSLNKDGQLGLKYFKEALDYYNKNQVKKPRLQRSLYNNIGLIYKNFEAYDSAIFYYRNGMEIEMAQTPDIIITDNINLSRLNISMGNYYKAFEHAQKSLDLSLESGDKEQIFVGYRTVGETYLAIGSNELALDYLTRALNVSIELNGFDDVDTYYLYHAVGKCYVGMKEYNYGKKYYLKYLDYLIKLHGLNHPKLTPVYHDLGAAYQKSAEYDSATYFFNQAISSANKKTSLFNIWRFHSLRELGNIEMERGNFNKAMVHLDAALQLKSADSSRNSSVWRLIGKTHFLRGQYQKSLNYYQRALNLTSIHTNGATANPDVGSINRKRTAIGILIDKAEAQTAIWRQSKSKAKNNLMSALSTYLSCDTLILNIRDLYRVESDVLTFNENTKRLYSGAVEVCFNLYQITADQRYFDLGFYFSERSKSSVLTSALASQTAIKYSGISDSLIEREAQLKSSLRFINSKYNKAVAERDTNRVQELKDRLFDLNSEYNKYVSYLEKNFSKYFNLKYNTWQISTSDIQRNLNNQCLIEYVDVNDSTIYAFILNKGIQSLVKIEKPREFDEWIDEFQDVFSHQQYESYQRVAYNLYRVLIDVLPDVVSESSDLIIVPDGNLWRINFEVLLTERSTQANFSDLPYLLKTKAISYANSANLLFGVGQRKNTPQLKECI
ncbi:MAG: tetratricopeptide repeat protein, partial [Bacteroidota bacterium]